MTWLQTHGPDLHQIVLPPCTDMPRPWATPCNVWLVGEGSRRTLVDTGWASARPVLLEALAELGVAPGQVERVLLTDLSPRAVGNVDVFPQARVAGHDPEGMCRRWRAFQAAEVASRTLCLQAMLEALEIPAGDPAWGRLEAWGRWWSEGPETLEVETPGDRGQVAGPSEDFACLVLPGLETGGVAWSGSQGGLFGGPLADLDVEPMVRSAGTWTASLQRLTTHPCRFLAPAHGSLPRSTDRAARALSLRANNLLSNIQYALDGTWHPAALRRRDLGLTGGDWLRLVGSSLTWEAVLQELWRVGVAVREGEGCSARYRIDRTPRTTTERLERA
jgi:glyoxylase-like metal-dependent hydrolase (beta-lactamase superfamily II)